MSYRKPKFIALRLGLIAILVALFAWSYALFSQNYERVELSQKMVSALLDNKTELAREYADQLGIVQQNLDRTEAFLTDIRDENMKLREKVRLLDEMKAMEDEIGKLKEANAKIQSEVSKLSGDEKKDREGGFMFKTIARGQELIREFKEKIHEVKYRIHDLKEKEHAKDVAIQKEIDRKETMLGNNGYLVRDGEPQPVHMPDMKNLPAGAKIKVKFVK